MIRTMIVSCLATAVAVAGVPAAEAQEAKQEPRPYTQDFSRK